MEDILAQINLSQQQQEQVEKILQDARVKMKERHKQIFDLYADVREQVQQQLKGVLTPDQWQQYQKMLDERKAQMKAEHDHEHPHDHDFDHDRERPGNRP